MKRLDVYNDLETLVAEIRKHYKTDGLLNIAIGTMRSQKSTITYLKGRVRNLVAKQKTKQTNKMVIK